MNIDGNYNSQFIQIDFTLLDNPEFLQFVNRVEFGTYLILRRFIWRGGTHRLGLHNLYRKQQKLASSISADKIASLLQLKDPTRVSKHLAYLIDQGVVQKIMTGRENIYILGEWHTPQGMRVAKEFYYLENRFGVSKSELAKKAKAELQESPGQGWHKEPSQPWSQKPEQTWRRKPSSNREENREENTVRNGVQMLKDRDLQAGEREYLVESILEQLGDEHSRRFYELVATKVPASFVRQALAEIKADGAEDPRKVFTYRMNQYVLQQLRGKIGGRNRAA